ncbi:MAG: phosphomannomutase/phosphoglucomutase [Chlorobi bacterium]|nr:phosphomannomutase/phosphoglucomutase [Chlorobiota bacterium]
MDYKALQNGSDIRGVALPGIEGEEVNLTPHVTERIAMAFARILKERTGQPVPKVSIGMDPRLSGPELAAAIRQGLIHENCEVYYYGLSTTPAMFMSTQLAGMDGAIMITASHLPFNRNGMKFFTKPGGLEKEEITAILDMAAKLKPGKRVRQEEVRQADFLNDYAGYLVRFIRKSVSPGKITGKPLDGMHILVDAGNGSGGFFASKVLEPLGADVSGSLYLDPDGRFPNHPPNPEDTTAMAGLTEAVKKGKADLGIIFDTDVDRAAIVDRTGKPVNRNRLIALISAVLLEEYPGTWIVTDSITSDGLTTFIEEKLGGHHHRFKRGYRNVINEAIRLNKTGKECHLAIETSGHAALKENYFLDDGAYLVARLLLKMARLKREGKPGLESLTENLPEPAEAEEFRMKILTPDFKAYGEKILDKLREWVSRQQGWTIVEPNYEGVRVQCDQNNGDGWFLLRLSLHDPVMPLNIESNKPEGVIKIRSKLKFFFAGLSGIDAGTLNSICI